MKGARLNRARDDLDSLGPWDGEAVPRNSHVLTAAS
jgi:hypothetical protein